MWQTLSHEDDHLPNRCSCIKETCQLLGFEDRVHYAEWQPGDRGCPEVEVEIPLVSALICLELEFVSLPNTGKSFEELVVC